LASQSCLATPLECGHLDVALATAIGEYPDRLEYFRNSLDSGIGLWIPMASRSDANDTGGFYRALLPSEPLVGLSNPRRPIMLGASCRQAYVGYEDWGVPSEFASARLLVRENGGVVAVVGNPYSTELRAQQMFVREFLRVMDELPLSSSARTVGVVTAEAKRRLLSEADLDHTSVQAILVLGDPALRLPMRGSMPQAIALSNTPEVPYAGQWTLLTAAVTDPAYGSNPSGLSHLYTWSCDRGTFVNGSTAYVTAERQAWWHCGPYLDPSCSEGPPVTVTVSASDAYWPCRTVEGSIVVLEQPAPPSGDTGGGGCPVLEVREGMQWQVANSVLSECAYDSSVTYDTDYLLWDPGTSGVDPYPDLRIAVRGSGEECELDLVSARVYYCPATCSCAVDKSGEVFSYSTSAAPVASLLARSLDVSEELASADGNYLLCGGGDSVTVVFGDSAVSASAARLLMRVGCKVEMASGLRAMGGMGVRCSPSQMSGGGVIAFPRMNDWSECVTLGGVIRGDGSADTVVVSSGEFHRLDAIRMPSDPTALAVGQHLTLLEATTQTGARADTLVNAPDSRRHVGGEGDTLTLRFSQVRPRAGMRSVLVIEARGGYHLLPEELPKGVAGSSKPSLAGLQCRPNPCSGRARVLARRTTTGPAELQIFDVAGRCVREVKLPWRVAGTIDTWDWDGLTQAGRPCPSGVYFVRVRDGDALAERRLVLVRGEGRANPQ
jgi:hypothetical protein